MMRLHNFGGATCRSQRAAHCPRVLHYCPVQPLALLVTPTTSSLRPWIRRRVPQPPTMTGMTAEQSFKTPANGPGAATKPKAPADLNLGEKLATLADACSWRAPLVAGPLVWFLYSTYQQSLTEADPFSKVNFLVPLIGTTAYLAFVFVGKYLMKDREAFDVSKWMLVYNLYQTCFNMYAVYAFIYEVAALGGPWWGLVVDRTPRGSALGFVIWMHYNNKYLEFMDTVFMVLRKKNKQVSFLHVYHHWLLVWSWYFVCLNACGGDAYFGAVMNSFIHVVMYGYYLLAALKLPCPWKKYVTQLQLLQFVICFTHGWYIIYLGDEYFPRWLAGLEVFVMTNMFVLFTHFYNKSYKEKKAAAKKAQENKSS